LEHYFAGVVELVLQTRSYTTSLPFFHLLRILPSTKSKPKEGTYKGVNKRRTKSSKKKRRKQK